MKGHNLPLYEWNLIDIFTAYPYELSFIFWVMFIVFTALWLRAHNVRNPIKIRMDNGSEICGGSLRNLEQCKRMLSLLF